MQGINNAQNVIQLIKNDIEALNSMPIEQAVKYIDESWKRIGILDEDGNYTPYFAPLFTTNANR